MGGDNAYSSAHAGHCPDGISGLYQESERNGGKPEIRVCGAVKMTPAIGPVNKAAEITPDLF
jgi:hypothetical protein